MTAQKYVNPSFCRSQLLPFQQLIETSSVTTNLSVTPACRTRPVEPEYDSSFLEAVVALLESFRSFGDGHIAQTDGLLLPSVGVGFNACLIGAGQILSPGGHIGLTIGLRKHPTVFHLSLLPAQLNQKQLGVR